MPRSILVLLSEFILHITNGVIIVTTSKNCFMVETETFSEYVFKIAILLLIILINIGIKKLIFLELNLIIIY